MAVVGGCRWLVPGAMGCYLTPLSALSTLGTVALKFLSKLWAHAIHNDAIPFRVRFQGRPWTLLKTEVTNFCKQFFDTRFSTEVPI